LIELLVVIAIVAILISLLSPALRIVKDIAKVTVCEANLRQWGVACQSFAPDHRRILPRAWRNNWTNTGYLVFLNWGVNLPWRDWQTHGTFWNTWKQYGITEQTLLCPGRGWPNIYFWSGSSDNNWMDVVSNTYMYMGGVTVNCIGSIFNFHEKWPAVTQMDRGLSSRVLAADTVYRGGGPTRSSAGYAQYWPDVSDINHRAIGDPERVGAQNILFGDGHVATMGGGYYDSGDAEGRLNCETDFTFRHASNGAFFFWEGSGN
jgi:type II secretory pathway pseudopilin PulG